MNKNLKGEFVIMDSMGIKPNYAALGRKYGIVSADMVFRIDYSFSDDTVKNIYF